MSTGAGVAIRDSSHGHELLGSGGGNQSSTTGGRDETNTYGSALSGNLVGNGVRNSILTSPVSTTYRGYIELGGGDGSTDSSGYLRGTLDSKTNVSGTISKGNEGLETGTLSGRRLLLNRHDLHNLIVQLLLEEVVDNLGLLDGNGEEEDLLDGSDLALLYETAELGDGSPDVLVAVSASASAAPAASAISSASASTAATSSETSTFFRHD
eukprot:595642_1